MKKYQKKIKKKLKKARKWLVENNFTPENVMFSFLAFFSLTFMGLLWGISEQMKNEPINIAAPKFPSRMELEVGKMVNGHPMEKMTPFIAKQNSEVAKYLVAIAKKESNWGKHSPKKDGRDCFNYWGYRGDYNQTKSGYSCFDSPRQAVRVVGERIGELLAQNIQTPEQMVVWKCGQSCDGFEQADVQKWIKDVGYYHDKL